MTRNALIVAALAAVALAMAVQAGPPLICHPFEVSTVLPSVDGLDRDTPVLVRMETLRRAVVACDRDDDEARTLLATLMSRTLDAEAAGRKDSLVWFDVGFVAQSMDQNGVRCVRNLGVADGIVGYAWVSKALQLGDDDPQMHFAAALVTALYNEELSSGHIVVAEAGAAGDPLLARNMDRFRGELGEHLDHHRRNYASRRH